MPWKRTPNCATGPSAAIAQYFRETWAVGGLAPFYGGDKAWRTARTRAACRACSTTFVVNRFGSRVLSSDGLRRLTEGTPQRGMLDSGMSARIGFLSFSFAVAGAGLACADSV